MFIVKVFLWASFFAIIAFFTHKQLSTEVITFEESIFIHGVSKIELFEYIKDVKVSMRSQPSSQSVTDVIYIYGDGSEPDKIKFNYLEKVSLQGIYEQVIETPVVVSLFPSIPSIHLDVNLIEGLVIGSVNIVFKDALQDGKQGVLITETIEIITPYFFAKFAKEGTRSTQKMFLKNAKSHFNQE